MAQGTLTRGAGALTLVWLAVATLATAQAAPLATPRTPAKRLTGLPGLQNVARINSGLYRGAAPTVEGLRSLKTLGVKTVINLRHYHGNTEERACSKLGLDYVRIALASTDAPRDEDVRLFLSIVTDPRRQPVYFHCLRGKDRTGTLAAVYRITVEKWPLGDALREMDSFGPFKGYKDLRGYVGRIAEQPTLVWP